MSENQASLKKYFEFLNSLNETKMFNEALKKVDLAEIKKIAFNKKTIYEEFEDIFSSKVKKLKEHKLLN